AIQTSGGDQVRVWELQGKPVVLNFWASWCGPCVEEGGVLADASSAHSDLAFVGANNQDTPSGFQAFELRHPHSYPAGPIVTGSYQAFGVGGLPATVFIDPQGIVVASLTCPLAAPTLAHHPRLLSSRRSPPGAYCPPSSSRLA